MVKLYYYLPGEKPELFPYHKENDLPSDCSYLIVKLGQNDLENSQLVKGASPKDWWFHLANFPSGHALTYFQGSKNLEDFDFLKEPVLKFLMAQLVKGNSKQKNLRDVKIHYCQRKNLKLTDKAGLVILKKTPLSLSI